MNTSRLFQYLFIVCFSLSLANCKTVSRLSSDERSQLHAIKVDPSIEMPQSIAYRGDDDAPTRMFLGNIAGGLVMNGKNSKVTANLEKIAKHIHFSYEGAIKKEIVAALRKRTQFTITKNHADAILHIKVIAYSLENKAAFSKQLEADLHINASLIKNNKLIWRHSFGLQNKINKKQFKQIPQFTLNQIYTKPERLQEIWQPAIKIVSRNIADKLVS